MLHLSTRRFCSDSRDQLKNLTTRSANTKVGGRFGMKRCGPSCRHTRNASAVFKIFVLHPKKTFATISATNGHSRNNEAPLTPRKPSEFRCTRVGASSASQHARFRRRARLYNAADPLSRIDFLECLDCISNVFLLIRREMEAPDHRMNFFHTGGGLSLPDRVDHAAMAARS